MMHCKEKNKQSKSKKIEVNNLEQSKTNTKTETETKRTDKQKQKRKKKESAIKMKGNQSNLIQKEAFPNYTQLKSKNDEWKTEIKIDMKSRHTKHTFRPNY